MNNNFPLYTTLSQKIPSSDLQKKQKEELVDKIQKLDTESYELIYVLIKCYYIEHSGGDQFTIPYDGQLYKERIEFNLLNFPNKLRQILYKFVMLHEKREKEEKTIDRNVQSAIKKKGKGGKKK